MVVNISLTKLDLLQIKTSRNENFFFFFTFHPFFSNYECCGKRREYYIVTWKTINGISKENYKITHNSQWHGCSIAMVGWQRVPTLSPRPPPPPLPASVFYEDSPTFLSPPFIFSLPQPPIHYSFCCLVSLAKLVTALHLLFFKWY